MNAQDKVYRVGQRVELHPATDWWMRGARFGEVVKVGRSLYHVRLDRTGRVVKVSERNIGGAL